MTSIKGKEKAAEDPVLRDNAESASESDSDSDSSSATSSSSHPESGPENDQEYMNSLLEKAREAVAEKVRKHSEQDEDIMDLPGEPDKLPIPKLDPGPLPTPYFTIAAGSSRRERPKFTYDPSVESAKKVLESFSAPTPPIRPPELSKSGKPLTKKQQKELKKRTAGPSWFDLPAPQESELPRLYKEVEAMRLRNQMDPKRHYRKEEGEGKGVTGLPKYFAIGTIIPSNSPFGASTPDNLPRSSRKRTLVEELVDDAESKRYAKRKFEDLQRVRGARGRNTLRAKQAARAQKF